MHSSPSRRRRLASLLTAIGGALLILATSLAISVALAAGAQPEQVTICHQPGTPAQQTMSVPSTALGGHLGHGDHQGSCQPLDDDEDEGGNDEDPVDACPGDLNPGIQKPGSECVTDDEGNDEEPVDACPGELNPGIQEQGATCVTEGGGPGAGDTPPPSSDPKPGSGDSMTPGEADAGDQAPVGDVGEADTLTIEDVQDDGPATVGGETDVPGAADAAGGGDTAVAGAADAAGAVTTPSGDLPYTGGPAGWIAALGALLVALGVAGNVLGARAEVRRTVA